MLNQLLKILSLQSPLGARRLLHNPQANTPPPLSLLRKEICPRSSRVPLHLLLLPEGTASVQEPCRASGAAFLAQTVFNLEHNKKLDLQTLGKILRSACRFLLRKYNKDLDSLPGFPHVSQGTPPPTPQQLKGLYKALSKGIYCRINASFFKKIKQTEKEVDNTLHWVKETPVSKTKKGD